MNSFKYDIGDIVEIVEWKVPLKYKGLIGIVTSQPRNASQYYRVKLHDVQLLHLLVELELKLVAAANLENLDDKNLLVGSLNI